MEIISDVSSSWSSEFSDEEVVEFESAPLFEEQNTAKKNCGVQHVVDDDVIDANNVAEHDFARHVRQDWFHDDGISKLTEEIEEEEIVFSPIDATDDFMTSDNSSLVLQTRSTLPDSMFLLDESSVDNDPRRPSDGGYAFWDPWDTFLCGQVDATKSVEISGHSTRAYSLSSSFESNSMDTFQNDIGRIFFCHRIAP